MKIYSKSLLRLLKYGMHEYRSELNSEIYNEFDGVRKNPFYNKTKEKTQILHLTKLFSRLQQVKTLENLTTIQEIHPSICSNSLKGTSNLDKESKKIMKNNKEIPFFFDFVHTSKKYSRNLPKIGLIHQTSQLKDKITYPIYTKGDPYSQFYYYLWFRYLKTLKN